MLCKKISYNKKRNICRSVSIVSLILSFVILAIKICLKSNADNIFIPCMIATFIFGFIFGLLEITYSIKTELEENNENES